MANQHTKRKAAQLAENKKLGKTLEQVFKDKPKTPIVDSVAIPTLAELQTAIDSLAEKSNKLSDLVADVLDSIQQTISGATPTACYLEGAAQYKPRSAQAVDPVHAANDSLRNVLMGFKAIVTNANNIHAVILGKVIEPK